MSRAQRLQQTGGAITPRALPAEMATGDRFLVLLEGTHTERRYLDDLCGKLRFAAYNVVIETPDSDPLHLVENAIKWRQQEQTLADRLEAVAYDQVWVVCDRERQHHHRFPRLQQAFTLAQAHGIHIALSIPCFEYWLLLHHRLHPGVLADCEAVEAQLTAEQSTAGLPGYDKSTYPLDFYVVRNRVKAACERGRRMREHHTKADPLDPPRHWTKDYILRFAGANQPDGNPCTDMDELIRQFNRAANPRLRFVQYQDLPAEPFLDP